MKILFLNTSDRTGGAAVAADRLRKALRKEGLDVSMLVRDKRTADASVASVDDTAWHRLLNRFRFYWERLVVFLNNRLSRENLFAVSIADTGTDVSAHPLAREADIIHLHWVNQGFLSLKGLKRLAEAGKPVVWTMHDMWPCTGICHHAWMCGRFCGQCGECPFLKSGRRNDLSHRVWKKKRNFLKNPGIYPVAVSSWLAGQAKKSSLMGDLEISVIPNAIDTSVFTVKEKALVREKYGFPSDKKIVLMGAARLDVPIKGFPFLKKALEILAREREDLLLVLFGAVKQGELFFKQLDVPFVSMGLLDDNGRIADLYSAADVTVVPSFYETFGQTLIESMACGCPAVSFDNSGQTDIIDHRVNGYLARYKDAGDLADGIRWVLDYPDKRELSAACLKKVRENYAEEVVAKEYARLYRKLMEERQRR